MPIIVGSRQDLTPFFSGASVCIERIAPTCKMNLKNLICFESAIEKLWLTNALDVMWKLKFLLVKFMVQYVANTVPC